MKTAEGKAFGGSLDGRPYQSIPHMLARGAIYVELNSRAAATAPTIYRVVR